MDMRKVSHPKPGHGGLPISVDKTHIEHGYFLLHPYIPNLAIANTFLFNVENMDNFGKPGHETDLALKTRTYKKSKPGYPCFLL